MSTLLAKFVITAFAVAGLASFGSVAARAAGPPEIRSHPRNQVPACVTPQALMDFLRARNPSLPARYQTIGEIYRELGTGWRIRWDYAFFQMVLETNYLQFKRGDGSPGDVKPAQNNFAGIGATGGGVPGDRFPDVRTGVLAQMQHLVAYSGERVAEPVAPRTREKQGDIIEMSAKLGRPVTFGDLAKRWAVDRNYATNIETVAELFRRNHCSGAVMAAAASDGATKPAPTGATAEVPARCQIYTASYGGDRVRLISSPDGNAVRITALTVVASEAGPMTDAFIRQYAPGGTVLGTFMTLDEALAAGRKVCPGSRPPAR